MLSQIYVYILDLARTYDVHPGLFFGLYVVSSILCAYLAVEFVRKARKKQPLATPAAFFTASWMLPYFYILVSGHRVPVWAYVMMGLVLFAGLLKLYLALPKRSKRRIRQSLHER